MSGRRREGLTPTLFPFLAVLVCTLGTLILLLALVAQNAGEAIAASQSRSADVDELPEQNDEAKALAQAADDMDRRLREAQWYRTQTVQMRDEQTADLEQRRDQLAHLEDHVRRLREELALLSSEVELSLQKKGDAHETQRTLDQLLIQIESEKTAIGKLQDDPQSLKPRIVIVPHKGPNGTDRRPIYILCDRGGIRLQPGGQRIELAHLEPVSGRPNPLDAALRTIRHHAMSTYGDSVAPYPLLVVTPGGIETYGVARAAMSHWDDQFGYELIPDGMELAFPAADPVLSDKIAVAIRQAIAQREAIARAGGGRGGAGGNGTGRGYAGGGYGAGGTGTSGSDAEPAPATVAGAESGGAGRGGAGDGAMQPASSLPVLSAAQMSRGDYGAAAGYPGSIQPGGSTMRSGPGYTGGLGSGGAPGGSTANMAGGPTAAQREAIAEAQRRLEQPGQGQGQWDTAPSPLGSALSSSAQGSQGSGSQGSGSQTADPQGNGPRETTGGSGASTAAADSLALTAPQTASAGSDTGNPAPASAAAGSNALSNSAGGNTLAGSAGGTAPTGGAGPQGAPAATTGTGGSQASGSAASAQAQGQPPDATGSPSLTFGNTNTPPVTRVGKDWGLPSSLISSRGTEMLRMIRVECHADRFVLLPEGGRGTPTTFRFDDGDINRASLELATAVRDRAEGWGAAMQGARWQPVLDVTVVSGGEVRYQQLLRLMDGSGVTIQAREPR